MARFIKGDKPSRSGDDSPTEEFDFAAIARDLNAENGPSSFDSLLSQPANSPAESSGDAAEAISLDDLFKPDPQEHSPVEVMPAQAVAEQAAAEQAMFEPEVPEFEVSEPSLAQSAVSPITPPVPSSQTEPVQLPEPIPMPAPAVSPSPQPEVNVASATGMASAGAAEAVETARSVKRSPLLPIGGGVVVVLLAGAALMMNRPASQEPLPTAPVISEMPPSDLAPAPSRDTPRVAPVAPKTSAPLGNKRPGASPIQNKTPGRAPVSGAPKPLTLQAKRQLKVLWNQGRDAKHRGDIESARRSWQQILKIRPGHPGIQEALDKLPPQP